MNVGPNLSNESATTVEHSSERGDPSRPLVLSDVLRREIVTHLQAWIPNEGCGLLASVPHGDVDRAVHFFPGTNIDRSPVRYTMDPVEVIGAMRRMRDEAWTLASIVHSHPRTPPLPSRTDLREAYYPDARLIIVSFAMPVPELRCWRLSSDAEAPGFVESQLLSG